MNKIEVKNLSKKDLKKAVIMAEVIGPPKARKRGGKYNVQRSNSR